MSQNILGGGLGTKSDVVHATFSQQPHIVLTHQRQKVCGCLEVPLELGAALDDSPGNGHGPLSIHQKIGVKQRHMLDVVARNEFGKLVDHPLDAIGVEAPFVENLVGAVIALVGAAYAAGVGQLPYAGHGRIDARVCQVICRLPADR